MPPLQDWIHKLEEGEGARYIKFGVVILGLFALIAAYDLVEFKNFATPEAMDSAQLARNIAQGEGFTTDNIRPLSIYLLQKQRGENEAILKEAHPDLANPPLYPLVLAGLMKVLPFEHEIPRGILFWRHQPELIIALFNQLLFYGAIFIVFRLALRLFDSSVAWMSALILAGTNLFWRFTISGLSTILLTDIFLALVWVLVVVEQQQREPKRGESWFLMMAGLAGLLVGLGGLTRYAFGWLIIPVVVYVLIYFGERRVRMAMMILAMFALVMGPWVMRNYNLSGNLFGTAGYAHVQETPSFMGNRLERFMSSQFEEELSRVEPRHVTRKLLVNLSLIVQNDLPRIGGNWISAFFLASLLIPFRNLGLSRLRVFVLLCLGVLMVAQALGRSYLTTENPDINTENLLVLLAPLIFVFGVGMYFILLDQIQLPIPQLRTVITAGISFLACSPLFFALLPPTSNPIAYPPYWPPGIQDISRWLRKDELMMSDMPWAVGWYGDRQCVWVTLDAPVDARLMNQSDFFAIYDYQKPIKGLYLTRLTTDAKFYSQMLKDKDHAWGRFMLESLLRTNVPSGFPLKEAPPGLLQEGQLFLSDYPRWKRPLH